MRPLQLALTAPWRVPGRAALWLAMLCSLAIMAFWLFGKHGRVGLVLLAGRKLTVPLRAQGAWLAWWASTEVQGA